MRVALPNCALPHLQEFHLREMVAAALKREKAADWLPEYRPISIVPPARGALTHIDKVTRVSPAAILQVRALHT